MTNDAYTDRCMSCQRLALYSPLNGICAQCTGTETEAQRAMAAYIAEKNNPRRDIYKLIRLWDDAVYTADKEKEAKAAIIKEDDPHGAEAARDIYHQARSKAYNAQADHSQPVNQDECDLAGWAAVIEAIQYEEGDEFR